MKDLLANVAIAGAATAGILTLIDWFLTDKNRAALSFLSVRMWNWLDNVSAKPILEWFYKGRSQRIIVVVVVVFFIVLSFFRTFSSRTSKNFPGALGEALGYALGSYAMFFVVEIFYPYYKMALVE
jgi:hypothetical protein